MIKISVVTPNGEVANDETNFVVARLDTGEMGFLENHTPIIARISDGFVRYNEKYIAVVGGVIDVNDNVITVVCQSATEGSSLEEAKDLMKKNRAKLLNENKRKMVDFAEAEKELIKNIKKAQASKL